MYAQRLNLFFSIGIPNWNLLLKYLLFYTGCKKDSTRKFKATGVATRYSYPV